MGDIVLGLDVGDARIGLAVGQVGLSFAFGRGYLTRTTLEADIAAVRDKVQETQAARVVIGLPKRTDGKPSEQATKTRAFARALEATGLTIDFEDERFTSQLATRQLKSRGLPKGKRQDKGLIDEAAAVLIVESYLSRVSRSSSGDPL
jgi:putative Holliday junction resolvase